MNLNFVRTMGASLKPNRRLKQNLRGANSQSPGNTESMPKSKIIFSGYSKIIKRVSGTFGTKSIISGGLVFWLFLNQGSTDTSI